MTEEIFRKDAYAKTCAATVTAIDGRGIQLDRTVFYATGGGQPGDAGTLRLGDGRSVAIVEARRDRESGDHLHVPAEGAPRPEVGAAVTAEIDWPRRHRLMRMHTAMHLLCALIPQGVTGGAVGEDKGRLDFDLPDTVLDKEQLTAALNRLIAEDHAVETRWITDAELAAKPDLVRTMSVKPPTGGGRVRLVEIQGVDLQPCGGTHVARTGEIGRVSIGKIENKGKHNRRITLHLED
ncbi:alanyl-tRNA editing protein [Shumkonia mesophila]|uniref:alanyl-tRNA editing protein n=1 Tax=Shumkonia mesophila TaxID=2838854 RepID=UPI002934760C|nr:alanyl-tRNA editing protein [Shumkonia mesophila]